MDVVQAINGLLGSASKPFAWLQNRPNPVRQQATHLPQAFEAHGIQRMQINWMVNFSHSNENNSTTPPCSANERIVRYKSPYELNQWLSGHKPPAENGLDSPNDEPASVLFDRIKVQRAAALKARR